MLSLSINSFLSSIGTNSQYVITDFKDIEIYFMRHGQSCANQLKELIKKNKDLKQKFLAETEETQTEKQKKHKTELLADNNSHPNNQLNSKLEENELLDFEDFEDFLIKKKIKIY
jgi:ABC-type nitrate/sulfonate/bicarbonate transport system substrate-binding protein